MKRKLSKKGAVRQAAFRAFAQVAYQAVDYVATANFPEREAYAQRQLELAARNASAARTMSDLKYIVFEDKVV